MDREKFLKYFNTLKIKIKKHSNTELENFDFVSKETITVLVTELLIEDVNFIDQFIECKFPRRYIDSLIRNLCEMVIEYLYIIEMKDEQLLQQYLGIPDDDYLVGLEHKNAINSLSKFGKDRFRRKRVSVGEMASKIKRKNRKNGMPSLYDIYLITSDRIHNPVFFSSLNILDEIVIKGDIESGSFISNDDDLYYYYVIDIVDAFMECYREVFSGA